MERVTCLDLTETQQIEYEYFFSVDARHLTAPSQAKLYPLLRMQDLVPRIEELRSTLDEISAICERDRREFLDLLSQPVRQPFWSVCRFIQFYELKNPLGIEMWVRNPPKLLKLLDAENLRYPLTSEVIEVLEKILKEAEHDRFYRRGGPTALYEETGAKVGLDRTNVYRRIKKAQRTGWNLSDERFWLVHRRHFAKSSK